MAFVSPEVKIWKAPGVDIQREGKKPFDTKIGPYHELSKAEAKDLSAKIMAELDEKIDWKKPDKVMYILPRFQPEKQTVKLSGKK